MLFFISENYRKSIEPLRLSEAEALGDVAQLRARVADAQEKIAEVRAREKDVVRIRAEIDQAQEVLPPGSPIDSFPDWVREHFAHYGVGTVQVRRVSARDVQDASGYERASWSVDVPIDETGRSVPKLLRAVADVDRGNLFLRVHDFEIRDDTEKPGARVGFLNIETVLRR
jgi:hypothetical protein